MTSRQLSLPLPFPLSQALRSNRWSFLNLENLRRNFTRATFSVTACWSLYLSVTHIRDDRSDYKSADIVGYFSVNPASESYANAQQGLNTSNSSLNATWPWWIGLWLSTDKNEKESYANAQQGLNTSNSSVNAAWLWWILAFDRPSFRERERESTYEEFKEPNWIGKCQLCLAMMLLIRIRGEARKRFDPMTRIKVWA
ncbi:4-hydroxy-3-methylbut-2-enyl diphosphatereductase [Striga asiatica]|uniref:4-hydroxy-3-methylbut-2-enyl diphosphatereductase n=1 Tax=Striga asiatica TaxID=4170 RepID=A0A5A7PWS1_STRAF|nr:4-hydroxy-3-methylbut-2-enyl diphosphatereductase [Striga asiatica]